MVMHQRDQRSEFIAAKPSQHIAITQLTRHSGSNLLQEHVTDMMAVPIVNQLEFVQIDVDQSEEIAILPRLFDVRVDEPFHGEAVGNVGKQIELRASAQVDI